MILVDYIYWHFVLAPRNIWEIAANYMRANWHRFLISQHVRTLFSPWHRRKPSDLGKPSSLEDRMVGGITDFYITILAAFARSFIILIGLFVEIITFALFTFLFFVWILWPIIAILLISWGLSLL